MNERCLQAALRNRTSADGKYLIIANEGSEFIITDGKGVYKREQIIISKVSTQVGEAATTEIKNITFNDEDAVQPLLELRAAYPNAEVFVTGDLAVDFPEDIQIPFTKNNYITISFNGTTLKLSYCPIDDTIALLKEKYAVGTMKVRIV